MGVDNGMTIHKSNKKKFIILALILIILLITYIFTKDTILKLYKLIMDGPRLKLYLESFGYLSGVVFLIFQILQVLIFIIPGEIIQAAGGYVFGTLLGTLISLIGIGIGSFILFVISHKYGRNFVEKFVSKDLQSKLENILSTKRKKLIVFILYLIPGMPKDCLVMICALTNMNSKDFIIWSMIGRIPALFLSSYFGANIASGNHIKAIIICIVAIIITVIVLLYKEKVFKKLKNI